MPRVLLAALWLTLLPGCPDAGVPVSATGAGPRPASPSGPAATSPPDARASTVEASGGGQAEEPGDAEAPSSASAPEQGPAAGALAPLDQKSLPTTKLALIMALDEALRTRDLERLGALYVDETYLSELCPNASDEERAKLAADAQTTRASAAKSFDACLALVPGPRALSAGPLTAGRCRLARRDEVLLRRLELALV